MKKIKHIILTFLIIFVIVSCGEQQPIEPPPPPPTKCECKAELNKLLGQAAFSGKQPPLTDLSKRCDDYYHGYDAYINEECPVN
jgi:hypothetical protein